MNDCLLARIRSCMFASLGCEELCPLDKFLKLTEDLEVEDIGSACKKQIGKLEDPVPNSRGGVLFLILVAASKS